MSTPAESKHLLSPFINCITVAKISSEVQKAMLCMVFSAYFCALFSVETFSQVLEVFPVNCQYGHDQFPGQNYQMRNYTPHHGGLLLKHGCHHYSNYCHYQHLPIIPQAPLDKQAKKYTYKLQNTSVSCIS